MSIGAGFDRRWLEPLDTEGRRHGDGTESYDDILGCHQGFSEGLNIHNPQPNKGYLWVRNNRRDILAQRRRGYEVVQSEDPEFAAFQDEFKDTKAASPLDTTQVYGDVILMRIPMEKLRRIREEEDRKARGMLRNRSEEFLARVSAAERALDPRGRGTRYAMSDHRYEVVDARTDLPLETWTPDQGIMER